MPDYYPLVERAVAGLSDDYAARLDMYKRLRLIQTEQLAAARLTPSEESAARYDLEQAIRRVADKEYQAEKRQKKIKRKASTTLLFLSMLLCPMIWVMDWTSMSLFWVARLPGGRRP